MQENRLVIPEPDSFGFRVTTRTPLALIVAALRRENPRAPFAQVKRAAEQIRAGASPAAASRAGAEVPRERTPDRFDSGAEPDAVPSGSDVDDARASGSEVAAYVEPNPARDEIARWVAEQRGRAKGLELNKSGRVPRHILAAYREDRREEYLASLVPVEGGAPMPAEVPVGAEDVL